VFGLFNINKPIDVTSRDVVNRVQRYVRPHKIGHAGTLDPLATGVLVICVGHATRLNEYIQQLPKSYRGTFLLGCHSETEDTEGEVVEVPDAPRPTLDQLSQSLESFRGAIQQRPPAFSALKVQGKRAYRLARRGKPVELEPRPVTIHRLELVRYAYPELVLDISCSSGTYIRSLGRDIGRALGTSAVMSALCRTAIGPFTIDRACSIRDIRSQTVEQHLLSPVLAVDHLPKVRVSDEQVQELGHGRFLSGSLPEGVQLAAALDPEGQLVALLSAAPKGGLKPHRFFRPSHR